MCVSCAWRPCMTCGAWKPSAPLAPPSLHAAWSGRRGGDSRAWVHMETAVTLDSVACASVVHAQCFALSALDAPAACGRLESMGYIKMINDLDARIAASKVRQLCEACKSAGFDGIKHSAQAWHACISLLVCPNPAHSPVTASA